MCSMETFTKLSSKLISPGSEKSAPLHTTAQTVAGGHQSAASEPPRRLSAGSFIKRCWKDRLCCFVKGDVRLYEYLIFYRLTFKNKNTSNSKEQRSDDGPRDSFKSHLHLPALPHSCRPP